VASKPIAVVGVPFGFIEAGYYSELKPLFLILNFPKELAI
jgi:hypothetical protein